MEEKRGDGNTGEGEIFDCERTNKDCKLQPNREDRVNKRPSTVRVIGMDKAVVKKRASRRAKKKGLWLGGCRIVHHHHHLLLLLFSCQSS